MQNRIRRTLFVVLCGASACLPLQHDMAAAENAPPVWAFDLARDVCRAKDKDAIRSALEANGQAVSNTDITRDTQRQLVVRFRLVGKRSIEVRKRRGGNSRLIISGGAHQRRADMMIQTGPACAITVARVVSFDDGGRPLELMSFDGDPPQARAPEPLNPPVPPGSDPGGVAVAIVDAGINYTLPGFAARLARNGSGKILGYDFHEDDRRPFDLDPSRPVYFPIRHGTAVASIILREAPDARLIPLRYAARNPGRFADIVEHIAAGPARIAAMSLGGSKRQEWTALERAIDGNPEILFIVSAGNDGRNIDETPVYPAGFEAENILTVTSTNSFGKLPAESNWGESSVDIAVPGERIDVTDHRGARARASGTSYAVPRVAALAARIAARQPDWTAARIKAAIVSLTAPLPSPGRSIRHGWIPNPAIE